MPIAAAALTATANHTSALQLLQVLLLLLLGLLQLLLLLLLQLLLLYSVSAQHNAATAAAPAAQSALALWLLLLWKPTAYVARSCTTCWEWRKAFYNSSHVFFSLPKCRSYAFNWQLCHGLSLLHVVCVVVKVEIYIDACSVSGVC
jgi:hypothetical protein